MSQHPEFHNQTKPSTDLCDCLIKLIDRLDIPAKTRRIAINFRHLDYYQTKQGARPVEIQLERTSDQWTIVFIASFAYPDQNANQVDVELYFNFKREWFYQPDIKQCELHQPKVSELYRSWEPVLLNHIRNRRFNQISAVLVDKRQ